MTHQLIENNPRRMQEMEKETRRLIHGLRPNRQLGIFSVVALVVGISIAIALFKIPYDEDFVWDLWAIPSILICSFFIVICAWCFVLCSTRIIFDRNGFRIRRWLFCSERQYDWGDATSLESRGIEHKYYLSDSTILKTMNNDDFGNSFYLAYEIFKSRYNLEE